MRSEHSEHSEHSHYILINLTGQCITFHKWNPLAMSFRWNLSQYIRHPERHKDSIKYHDDDFVLVKDGFPKSVIHWLLLPKDSIITKGNPLTVFRDQQWKDKVIGLIPKIKMMILEELERDYMVCETEEFIKVGVHAVPSMYNLHIHFITKDLSEPRMRNKGHYNSFTTNFFVPFEELPLSEGDERLDKEAMESLKRKADMICVYCGKNFYNKFAQLKEHLGVEWKHYKTQRQVITID